MLNRPVALEMNPIDTLSSADAVEEVPTAMALVPLAVASGPTAIESVPTAEESASVELAWKYLMPPPLLMLLTVVPMVSTAWLVAKSCEPLIASVEDPLIRPAATFVMVRSAPGAPTLTVEVAVVPAKL